jgi:rhomboid family GlyGly-CTERM serine protease
VGLPELAAGSWRRGAAQAAAAAQNNTNVNPQRSSQSSAAHWRVLVPVLVISLLVLVATWIEPIGSALEYRRALAGTEPWRLLGAHIVHINVLHAAVNLLAWWLVWRLFVEQLTPRRHAVLLLAAAAAVSAGLLALYPAIAWYRGLSGALHGLFFGAAALELVAAWRAGRGQLWPTLLLVGGAIKLALEQPAGDVLPHLEWLGAAAVPQAHLLGAAGGLVAAMLLARTGRAG